MNANNVSEMEYLMIVKSSKYFICKVQGRWSLPEKYFVRRPEGDFGKPSTEDFPSRDFFGLEKNFFIDGLCFWSKLF